MHIMIKTTKWSILFNQNPRRNHQTDTLSLKSGQRVSALVISSGFWLNRIPSECVFYHYPAISCIYSFMGNYTCVHIAIYLRFFTSVLLCLNVHLNCVSLDNHLVSNQPQWQCHLTMTWQWGHVTKQSLNLAGWGQIRGDQNEWFNHYWT